MANPQFDTMIQIFDRSIELHGERPLFGTKVNGSWNWLSYAEFGKLVTSFRAGLASLGIKHGDSVAIVSNNRVEWAVVAYACYGLGVALVPMYEAQLAKEWAFIVNDCHAVAMICATPEILAKCNEIKTESPSLKHIIGLSSPKTDPLSFAALIEAGEKSPVPAIKPEPSDLACLVYTSGTTGNPKGVELTHGNIASNITAIHQIFQIRPEDRSLSFLPWAHSFGHTCELHWFISSGASMAICEAVDKIIPNLAEVRPTILLSVPRVFNRIYDGVTRQMAAKPAPIRKLFEVGIRAAVARNKNQPLSVTDKLALSIADPVVFSKIRARFGGRLRYAMSGGAALSREVGQFIQAIGITLLEGYGLTETAPLATANVPSANRIGSVGKPIPGVNIVIDKEASGEADQGEIIIYGPNIMRGYHNRDDENKAVFTEDRGFRTGDLGRIDDDGFLFITGRIKEQYKLENGKYVSPAPLEELLKLSPFIVNSMVYGDNRLYNVALVVLDAEYVKTWASEQGLSFKDDAEMCNNDRLKKQVMAEVEKYSADWKHFEKAHKITLTAEDFTTQNNLLTPSLKVKRRFVWQKYSAQIEALYTDGAKAKAAS